MGVTHLTPHNSEPQMPQCAVCGSDISESIDRPVGKTVAGTPELDPSRGTKRYWDGVWRYFDSLACRSRFDSSPSDYAADA